MYSNLSNKVTGPAIRVERLTKAFRSGDVLGGLSFHEVANEFISVFGPNGCGKTTLVRILSGVEEADDGVVLIDGEPPGSDAVPRATVFQDYALFDWKTVRENVAFGLIAKGVPAVERAPVIEHYLGVVGLSDHAEKYPSELSGGLKQRCALARALALEPRLLLLDEPFSALDSETRYRLHELIVEIWEQQGRTILLVTHDPEEAVFLSDRVLVLSEGPAVVKKDIRIDIPRPRRRELRFQPQFGHYVAEVTRAVEKVRSVV